MLNCLIIYLIYAYLLFKFITFIFLIKNFLKITTNYRGIYIIKDFIYKKEIINFLKFKEQKFIKNGVQELFLLDVKNMIGFIEIFFVLIEKFYEIKTS